jgi:flagellar biosynthesis protein FlhB
MADQMSDRTEAPTSKRLSDARNRGQVVKSQDLAGVDRARSGRSWCLVVFGALTIATTCAAILRRAFLGRVRGVGASTWTGHSLRTAMSRPTRPGLPCSRAIGLLAGVACVLAHFVQVGSEAHRPSRIMPTLDEAQPDRGRARVLGSTGATRSGPLTHSCQDRRGGSRSRWLLLVCASGGADLAPIGSGSLPALSAVLGVLWRCSRSC